MSSRVWLPEPERAAADPRALEEPARVIAVPLAEREWRAFLSVEPDPVAWVRRQIRERLARGGDR